MAFKVCIAWAISAVALLVSSALASPAHKGSSQPFPSIITAEEGADPASDEEKEKEEEEEIED